jgi:hypothetical protein
VVPNDLIYYIYKILVRGISLEKRIIRLNFKNGYGLFDVNENQDGFSTFEFEKRRQLIPLK